MDECKEILHLEKLRSADTDRSTHLIVGDISRVNGEGVFDGNEHWAFDVGYAFRSALDITYDQRQKKNVKYMVWTQGPLLRFDVGDLIHSKDGFRAVAVTYAMPMGWDVKADSMYEGIVSYDTFDMTGEGPTKLSSATTTQVGFLRLLICGIEESPRRG